MITEEHALQILRESLNNDTVQFRKGQWESIHALVNLNKKVHVVQRTGWGKSSVYFITTRLIRARSGGITIIISPLLALIRNQIEAAGKFGLRAATINSSNYDSWTIVKHSVLHNHIDILYISPERLSNARFINEILLPISSNIGLFVVDESHCISDWGHDFRVDYRRIIGIVQQMPSNLPIIATTATANDRVIEDVEKQLGQLTLQRGSLKRDSLSLQNVNLNDQPTRLVWLAENLPKIQGTGIIYTLTKRDARIVTEWLVINGIDALSYYSGITNDEFASTEKYREHLEDCLKNNKIKALVATVALGMGYDKPDLGFVIHYQAPGSIVGYYQQVGRAGRGISNAAGILLCGIEDDEIHEFFRNSSFPPKERIDDILHALEESDNGLTINELTKVLNYKKTQISGTLKYLSVEALSPVIKSGSKWLRTVNPFTLDVEKIARLTNQREQEWIEVQNYIEAEGCLMQYLQNSLDDPHPEKCDKCANCLEKSLMEFKNDFDMGVEAAVFLKKADIPLNLKKQIPADSLHIYREYLGKSEMSQWNLPTNLRGEKGKILSRWKDAGWGTLVAQNKHNKYFNDVLVDAMADMIQRWVPEPFPTWLCCVPSLKNPTLVSDYAKRLANKLGINYLDIIKKAIDNPPQKLQENSYHQSNNLDGVFSVAKFDEKGAVFLVDDAVDSGWTLTIISALLLKNGSGPVFPIALTSTNIGA